MSENKRTANNECHYCKHKRNVPGDTHIKCLNPDSNVKGHKHGIEKGWFLYPELFDPIWKLNFCKNFEVKINGQRLG